MPAKDSSKDEQAAVKCLVNSEIEASASCPNEHSLADIAFSMLKAQQNKPDMCLDTWYIMPTLNLCERLHFQAQSAFINYRKRMSSIVPGAQVLFYIKRRFWGINDINGRVF